MNILSSLNHKVLKELRCALVQKAFSLPIIWFKRTGMTLAGLYWLAVPQAGYAVTVTTSIPPLAGMIAPLLAEDDQLEVILKPGASPHGFQLKPSDLTTLQKSDLVLWVGTPVDNWLQKPIDNFKVKALSMQALADVEQLPIRQGGLWERKSHKHLHTDHEEAHNHEHSTVMPKMDGHLWMSLPNAQSLIKAASKQLQQLKPEQAALIEQKTQAWLLKIAQTDLQIQQQLQPVKQVPYMVLHDAFQYFEHRYDLNGVGSIQLNPAVSPSLKRVAELRQKIKHGKVRCVFKEPQFPAKRVAVVTNGLDVQVGSLDPIGLVSKADQQDGAADYLLYDVFFKRLASQFYDCLATRYEK